jgi:chemotaxis protein methyltransferase CheR
MMATPDPGEVERFRAVIARRLGLNFDDAKLGFLGEVLQRRLDARKCAGGTYLAGLESGHLSGEVPALGRELTINETYFFRNKEQFRALAGIALPERMRVERTPRVLRILSAGCASGEEAYTIAIVGRESITDPTWELRIRAVDLNPAMLERAAEARYSAWALRETSSEVRRRWFRPQGRDMILDDSIRGAVQFDPANLMDDDPGLWPPSTYDVIFCRNVIMYFSPEHMRAVVARITQSLAPGGFLFLGHAETLRSLSDDFHLRHTHDTFYYERKGDHERTAAPPVAAVPRVAAVALPDTAFTEAWIDTIRGATERVASLIPAPSSESSAPAPAWDRNRALDLLRRERFSEALDCVREQPPDPDGDPDKLLLEATLLAHGGRFEAAADACRQLLLIDELNAGAHYVLALCYEQAGDRDAAAEEDRVAIYLDPSFAMPRLHLGLLARRAGDHDVGRRELGRAQLLLKREDPSRLLLFGGGFNREALVALCDSALRSCGGRP